MAERSAASAPLRLHAAPGDPLAALAGSGRGGEHEARVIVHRQIRDLIARADLHCATSARAASAHPGAAGTRATGKTVALVFRPPHGIHRPAHAHHLAAK